MKALTKCVVALLLLVPGFEILAAPGDTIVVQTIDFETPVNSGWNAPRSGWYEFPPAETTYEKILMYYTLKCDPSQSPACGEWDYLTHTFLYKHTGVYDSTLLYHPNFKINGTTPDTLAYMSSKSWAYLPRWEYSNQTQPTGSYNLGAGDDAIEIPGSGDADDGKAIFLWHADELNTSGLTAGELTGVKIYVNNDGADFTDFSIRMANTSIDALNNQELPLEGFTQVFKTELQSMTQTGWYHIPFSFPFEWDGNSSIAIELSYSNHTGDVLELAAGATGFSSMAFSGSRDYALNFENWDLVDLPVEPFNGISDQITISCWVYGASFQPQNDNLFEAVNGNGNRVLSAHLPWSNSNVYWDAGWDGGYDRISRLAFPENFKGQWNHWAFTKNTNSGFMRIYLNGILWFHGSSKNNLMDGIETFHLGTVGIVGNTDRFYDGMIDEFRVWNTELDMNTIGEWMYRSVDDSHPAYENLVAYYQFDEGEGFTTSDNSLSDETAPLIGAPQWAGYSGQGRLRDFEYADLRPQIVLETGNYSLSNLDSTLVIDTIAKDIMMVVLHENLNNPTQPTDSVYCWPAFYNNYVFDENGIALDSTFVAPEGYYFRQENPYYGTPFELVNRFELGRYITPYGNGLSLGDGWTWVYDVTDYEPFLHDSVHLSAGNFQELLDMKFYMIEGTSPRNVKSIQNIYTGSHSYSNPENHNLPPVTCFIPEDATTAKLKIRTTGHGFGGNANCSEFCPRTNKVLVNGDEKYSQYLWRVDCARNPLYPQGGTWLFNRAEWCPGAEVKTWDFEITPWIVSGDSVTVDYDLQDGYTWNGAGSAPYYYIESQFVTYGDPNYTLDAEISDIMAPNNRNFYSRINPVCANPVVIIRNNGTDILSSLSIEYGPVGGTLQTYQWVGQLGFMDSTTVLLDPIDWSGWFSGNNRFTANISNINGGDDENLHNNSLTVPFNITPEWPNVFKLKLKSNHAAWQTLWTLKDDLGNILFENGEMENNTIYIDTIELDQGCYNLRIDDLGGDGLQFWYNMPPNGNGTAGYAKIYNMNDQLLFTFKADFGEYVQQAFSVGMALNAWENQGAGFIEAYPNPSTGVFRISYNLMQKEDLRISIVDVFGNELEKRVVIGAVDGHQVFDMRNQEDGVYLCLIKTNEGLVTKKIMLIR